MMHKAAFLTTCMQWMQGWKRSLLRSPSWSSYCRGGSALLQGFMNPGQPSFSALWCTATKEGTVTARTYSSAMCGSPLDCRVALTSGRDVVDPPVSAASPAGCSPKPRGSPRGFGEGGLMHCCRPVCFSTERFLSSSQGWACSAGNISSSSSRIVTMGCRFFSSFSGSGSGAKGSAGGDHQTPHRLSSPGVATPPREASNQAEAGASGASLHSSASTTSAAKVSHEAASDNGASADSTTSSAPSASTNSPPTSLPYFDLEDVDADRLTHDYWNSTSANEEDGYLDIFDEPHNHFDRLSQTFVDEFPPDECSGDSAVYIDEADKALLDHEFV